MLEHFAYLVIGTQLVGINPHTLSHQERIVAYPLLTLDLKACLQLVNNQIQLFIQFVKECLHIALCLQRNARQVNRCKTQIAASVDNLTGRVIYIADDTGTAAHVSSLGLRMSRLVVLCVERRIQEREVREQTLCRHTHCQFEQVIVRVSRIVVDAFLDLENVNREDGSLTIAQTCLCCQQQALHGQTAFLGGIGTIVQ